MVARYGGEEILIVLPGADVQSPRSTRSIRCACAVGLTDIALPKGGDGARPGVDRGGRVGRRCAATMDGLLEIADARLYEAKEAGRNRVVGPGTAGTLSLFEQA